jgi:hypothetical protein
MNERLKELAIKAKVEHCISHVRLQEFAEVLTDEFIGLLEYEIAMLEKYKTTSCNDYDRRWHEGKIVHFHKLIDKTKDHFGVKE